MHVLRQLIQLTFRPRIMSIHKRVGFRHCYRRLSLSQNQTHCYYPKYKNAVSLIVRRNAEIPMCVFRMVEHGSTVRQPTSNAMILARHAAAIPNRQNMSLTPNAAPTMDISNQRAAELIYYLSNNFFDCPANE